MPKENRPVKQLSSPLSHILDGGRNPAKMRAMSDPKPQPQFSDKGLSEAELRRRRQAEALRANLARRKAQVRSRAEEEPTAPSPEEAAVPGAEGGPQAED